MRLIGKPYRAESLAKDWTPARRLRLRARYSAAVVRQIERLLLTHLHSIAPSSLLGEALHYLHGQWPKLVRFLDNGSWPLDPNPVENAIRPFVVGRRSWLFADTVRGANASANLYSCGTRTWLVDRIRSTSAWAKGSFRRKLQRS